MTDLKNQEYFERIKRGETVNILTVYAPDLLAYINNNDGMMQLKIEYNFVLGQTKFMKW